MLGNRYSPDRSHACRELDIPKNHSSKFCFPGWRPPFEEAGLDSAALLNGGMDISACNK